MMWELWLPHVCVLCPFALLTLNCYLLKSVLWSLFVVNPVLWGFHRHCRSLYWCWTESGLLRVSDSPSLVAQAKILGLEQNPPQHGQRLNAEYCAEQVGRRGGQFLFGRVRIVGEKNQPIPRAVDFSQCLILRMETVIYQQQVKGNNVLGELLNNETGRWWCTSAIS